MKTSTKTKYLREPEPIVSDEYSDAFIVERWVPRTPNQADTHPRIRVRADAYAQLANVAAMSRQSVSAVATKAILYAMAHLEYVDME